MFSVKICFPTVLNLKFVASSDSEKWIYERTDTWLISISPLFLCMLPKIEPRTSCMSRKHFRTELHFQYFFNVFIVNFWRSSYNVFLMTIKTSSLPLGLELFAYLHSPCWEFCLAWACIVLVCSVSTAVNAYVQIHNLNS